MTYHILKDAGAGWDTVKQEDGPGYGVHLQEGPGWNLDAGERGQVSLFCTGPNWLLSDNGGGWQLHDIGTGWSLDDGERGFPFSLDIGERGKPAFLCTGPEWSLDTGGRGQALLSDGGPGWTAMLVTDPDWHFGPVENDQPIAMRLTDPEWQLSDVGGGWQLVVGPPEGGGNPIVFGPPDGWGSLLFGPGEGNEPILH